VKAHIIHAHPEPTSFSAAMKDVAAAALAERSLEVVVSDLYADGFDAVGRRADFTTIADPDRFHYQTEQLYAQEHDGFAADLAREQARFSGASLLIFTFPIWWGGPPAILKGWFDRVLACGFAYVDGRRFETGFFQGVACLAGVTTGGTAERFSRTGVYGEIGTVLWPVQRCVFDYLGLRQLPLFVAYATPRVDAEQRRKYLDAWRDRVAEAADGMTERTRSEEARG
jgi:NAD(P)H dehydrogenase (quinone)